MPIPSHLSTISSYTLPSPCPAKKALLRCISGSLTIVPLSSVVSPDLILRIQPSFPAFILVQCFQGRRFAASSFLYRFSDFSGLRRKSFSPPPHSFFCDMGLIGLLRYRLPPTYRPARPSSEADFPLPLYAPCLHFPLETVLPAWKSVSSLLEINPPHRSASSLGDLAEKCPSSPLSGFRKNWKR